MPWSGIGIRFQLPEYRILLEALEEYIGNAEDELRADIAQDTLRHLQTVDPEKRTKK